MLFVDGGTDNVMIGTSVNIDRWFNSAPGHSTIFQTSGFDDANRVNAFTHHSNDSGSAMVMLGKSRGGAVGYTAVAESDEIGQISFQGADGTDMVEAAKILAVVDGTPGANDMPGRLVFHTTADGASSSTERMRIDNAGNVGIGTSSPQTTLHVEGTAPIIRLSDSNSTSEGDAVSKIQFFDRNNTDLVCLLYTSPSPRDGLLSRMPSSA